MCLLVLNIYVDLARASFRKCKKEIRILIGCSFANSGLTHATCLGIALASLYCFS